MEKIYSTSPYKAGRYGARAFEKYISYLQPKGRYGGTLPAYVGMTILLKIATPRHARLAMTAETEFSLFSGFREIGFLTSEEGGNSMDAFTARDESYCFFHF